MNRQAFHLFTNIICFLVLIIWIFITSRDKPFSKQRWKRFRYKSKVLSLFWCLLSLFYIRSIVVVLLSMLLFLNLVEYVPVCMTIQHQCPAGNSNPSHGPPNLSHFGLGCPKSHPSLILISRSSSSYMLPFLCSEWSPPHKHSIIQSLSFFDSSCLIRQ